MYNNSKLKTYAQLESYYSSTSNEDSKVPRNPFDPSEKEEEEQDIEKQEDEKNEIHQGMTADELEKNVQELTEGESVSSLDFSNPADAARYFVNNFPTLKAGHCWDWVKKVYDAAGFTTGQSWQDLNYTGKIAGSHRASPSQLQSLQPGDWIYINNRNQYDTHGNHSVIFLGWKGPNIAEVASYYDNSSHIHSYNVNEYPVTHISKYVAKPNKLAIKADLLIKKAQYFYKLSNIA